MTRGRDIFWGLYAAVMPILFLNFGAYAEGRIKAYVSRTYDSVTGLYFSFGFALLFGILLAVMAVHFLSKPQETSRLPLIGLVIGLAYCVVGMLYWVLGILEFDTVWIIKIAPYVNRNLRVISFIGFYAVLLIVYCKTHIFVSREELQKETASQENDT